MKITNETYPYGSELLGYENSVAKQLAHLLHELRDEYNVQFEFEYENNGINGSLTIEGNLLVYGDAKKVESVVNQWMWMQYNKNAKSNIEKLKSLFPSHEGANGYYILSYPSYHNNSRPFPNVSILWEPFQDYIAGNGRMYAHNTILRFFELNQGWEEVMLLVKERVDLSRHKTISNA